MSERPSPSPDRPCEADAASPDAARTGARRKLGLRYGATPGTDGGAGATRSDRGEGERA